MTSGELKKVCSVSRHASETFHITANGEKTICNRKCKDWIRIGHFDGHDLSNAYLCRRCYVGVTKEALK